MIAITARRLSREDFVKWMADALVGIPTLPRDTKYQPSKSGDVTLAWPDFQSNARPIVCVAERQLQEFYAFVSTYSAAVRPFSAYFRVIPLELSDVLEQSRRERRNEMQLARMIAGASIAEIWMAAARRTGRLSNVLPLLQSSVSFVLGQIVLAGYGSNAFEWALHEWTATRAGQVDLESNRGLVATIMAWRQVYLATNSTRKGPRDVDGPIAAFISEAVESRAIRPDLLRSLSGIGGADVDLTKLLVASREERIGRFNETLADFRRRGENGLSSEFLAGLMLAIAGNGSFEMMRSAREFDGWLDGAVIWFGICAALFEESNVLEYANSAGRRIVRDLLRRDDPFDLPTADICSTELRFVGSNSRAENGQLGLHGSNSVEIEILPNVVTRALLQEGAQSAVDLEGRDMLLRTLDEMSHLAARARRILADRNGDDLYRPRRPTRNKS